MSGTKKSETRDCPYCKEQILSGAVKCKHCQSSVTPELPDHNGTCPYCKESIDSKAIKCKHCRSALLPDGCSCADDGGDPGNVALHSARSAYGSRPGLGLGGGLFGGIDPFDSCEQKGTDLWAECIGLGYPMSRCNVASDELIRRCRLGLPHFSGTRRRA